MFRYAVIATLAFMLGSATVAVAGPTISGYVGLIDGANTAAINASRELSVTDARLATEAVQKTLFPSFANGQRFSETVTLYTVPAGKTLVIDSIVGGSNMDPADHLLDIQFNFTSGDFIPYTVAVHPNDEGVFTQTGARIFRGQEAITAYAGPGTTITAFGTRDGTSLSGTALRVAISGHLVSTP